MVHKKYKGKDTTWRGIPCTSAEAKQFDTLQAVAEKEELGFKRATSYKSDEFVEGEWADVSIINDKTLDRDLEMVLPKGGDLTYFQKNPVITLNHNYQELPIGRAAWVKFEPKRTNAERIKMKTVYAPRPDDFQGTWKPQEVFALVKGGFLQGKSVGFIGLESREPTQKEIDLQPTLAECKRVISKWQLLEVAVATIPCNPSALVEATAKGLIKKSIIDALGIEIPDDTPTIWRQEKAKESRPRFARKWKGFNVTTNIEEEIFARLHGRP